MVRDTFVLRLLLEACSLKAMVFTADLPMSGITPVLSLKHQRRFPRRIMVG